jgi:hypothetical protein
MTAIHDANPDRLHDLLADRATQHLSDRERDELRGLLSASPETAELEYDHAAAAAELTWIAPEVEPMPASVRSRVETRAVEWLAERKGLRLGGGDADPAPRGASVSWLPWFAAAACLLVAVVAWWPARTPVASDRRAALLDAAGTSTVAWQDNDAGVTGDVVWNNDRQAGYMRFRGLAVNDPTVTQYQLWIFDADRGAYSDDIAVDGGVFDIDPATGDALVPISAKLPIGRPALFAVTTEPPGGVVKHNAARDPEKYRIILTAPVPG